MVDQHNRLLNQKHSHELLEFSEHNDVQFCQKISRSYILQYILQDDNKKNDRDEFLTKDMTQLLKLKKGKYWKYTRGIFHRFNERTKLKSKRRLIDTPIPKSTQQPMVLFPISKHNKLHPKIDKIAELKEDRNTISEYFIDPNNANCYCIPLNEILFSGSDRRIIIHASKYRLNDEEQRNNKIYAYEFGWAYNLHERQNRQIKDTIVSYLNQSFQGETRHIKKLLSNHSTMVVMILNRQSTLSDKIVESSIVSLVMFGVDDVLGTCVDFISTSLPYTGMNFGPLLLHIAQVFGSKAIKRLSKSAIECNFTTVLMCKKTLSFYYKRLGFEVCTSEEFLENGNFRGAGIRFEIDQWIKTNRNELVIMRTTTICPRMINHLSYFRYDIEEMLLNEIDDNIWKNMTEYEKLRGFFDDLLTQIIEERRYMIISDHVQSIFARCTSSQQFFEQLYTIALVVPVGEIYSTGLALFNLQNLSPDSESSQFSRLFEMVLKSLHLHIYFENINNDTYDNQECWIKIKCNHCNKHVMVKKQREEFFNTFLNKVITSIWFIHVFNLESVGNNEWYENNTNWNTCTSRRGIIYNKLKTAYHKDTLLNDDLIKSAYEKSLMALSSLWESLYFHYYDYFESMCDIFYLSDKKFSSEPDPRNVSKSFTERSKDLLKHIAPEKIQTKEVTKKKFLEKINLANRQKKKRERQIKSHRHKAEKEWKVIFYNDLDLQLRLRHIEFVNVEQADVLNPISEVYINEVKEERKIQRKKQKKSLHHTTDNYNHFLMYEKDGSSAHVVDEDWFHENDHEHNIEIRRITQETIKKCIENTNQMHYLSKTDIRLINKHVTSVKVGLQICKIKRVTEKTKDQFEEIINFEGHVSVSKMAYIGYDIKDYFHRLSEDWIEMNFKEKHPSVYKAIRKLLPGEEYKIPIGSSSHNFRRTETIVQSKKKKICNNAPITRYTQDNEPSCVPSSIASAFSYVGESSIADRIMRIYINFKKNANDSDFTMHTILQIIAENSGRQSHEKKWKGTVEKIKKPDTRNIVISRETNCIYHCVLINLHAVSLIDNWIFDPIVERAMPRDEEHIRFSSERIESETTDNIIIQCYKYTLRTK